MQLWRRHAHAAYDLAQTGAELQTADLRYDHEAVKSGLSALRATARERDEIEHLIERHEYEVHANESGELLERTATMINGSVPGDHSLRRLRDVERAHIERIVAETGSNLSQAARILEIDRSTRYTKLSNYGVK